MVNVVIPKAVLVGTTLGALRTLAYQTERYDDQCTWKTEMQSQYFMHNLPKGDICAVEFLVQFIANFDKISLKEMILQN